MPTYLKANMYSFEHRIPAIKELREFVGIGLREAKSIVDEICDVGYCNLDNYSPLDEKMKENTSEINRDSNFHVYISDSESFKKIKENIKYALQVAVDNERWRDVNIISEALEEIEEGGNE